MSARVLPHAGLSPTPSKKETTLRQVMKMAVVVAAGSLALAACSSSSSITPAASTGASGAAQIKVGMAYDVGGRGDQSFNDAGGFGRQR